MALCLVVLGVGVLAFPFVRNWYGDQKAVKLLAQLDSGIPLMVEEEVAVQGELDSWAEADGLDDFSYEEEDGFGDLQSLALAGQLTHEQIEIGEEDGLEDPAQQEEGAYGEIGLENGVEAQALDVEGLKKKRLVAIGSLRIPSIDADLPVVEGAGKTELRYALGHVAETADFGRRGNSVVAGHRNYTYGSMLNRLNEVVVGDEIIATQRDGTVVRYEVYEVLEVRPGASGITNFGHDEHRLTIITCTPLGVGTQRLLVRARVRSIE